MEIGHRNLNVEKIQELMFADDMMLMAESEEKQQQCLTIYSTELKEIKHNIKLEGQQIEQVKTKSYLSTIMEKQRRIDTN